MSKKQLITFYLFTCVCVLSYSESHASLVTFDFDTADNYSNPFLSIESPLVRFSEVGSGAVGSVRVSDRQSTTNVLTSAPGPGAPDEILMEFILPVTSLSFDVGHPSGLQADAWLRVFDGITQVAETRIALDSDRLFNQVIAYSGPTAITSARFALVETGRSDLGRFAESIDNLRISPVPVPPAIWLFGTALLGFVGLSKRRKAA